MSDDITRWAVVGTGGIASKTLPDLRLTENVEVVAVASRTQDAADAFAAAYGLPKAFGELERMLDDPEINVVYICTPHGTHFDYARQAIRAGKHVLCEKSLTMNVADARELQRLAAEHRVFLMEAMWTKFNPNVRRAIELVAAGAIGEPRFAQAGMGFAVPVSFERFWRPELGGGALYDMGVYPITMAQLFLGKPHTVTAVGEMTDDDIDLFEAVTMWFGSHGVAQVISSMTTYIPARVSIGGTAGSISFAAPIFAPPSFQLSTSPRPRPRTVEEFAIPLEGAGYVPMFRAVSSAVLAGQLEHEFNPMSATSEVLETMESVRDQLIAQRG